MLSNDKADYLVELFNEETDLSSKRCVVSVSPLDHHRHMLYREILQISPHTPWKPCPNFVSLDELNAPAWNSYFDNGGVWEKKKFPNVKPLQRKRRSSSSEINSRAMKKHKSASISPPPNASEKRKTATTSAPKVLEKEKEKSIKITFPNPKFSGPKQRKYGVSYGEAEKDKIVKAASAMKISETNSDKSGIPKFQAKTSYHSGVNDKKSSVPYDDIIERWMAGEYDAPEPPTCGEKMN